jgi:hypothetical protein
MTDHPDFASFTERYMGANAKRGDMIMPLGSMIMFEEEMCKAPEHRRTDPVRRIGETARMLEAAGSLLPEDQHLTQLGLED